MLIWTSSVPVCVLCVMVVCTCSVIKSFLVKKGGSFVTAVVKQETELTAEMMHRLI